MTREERQNLRNAAINALRGVDEHRVLTTGTGVPGQRWSKEWALQTSNSFRRIGQHGDGDVLCAVKQQSDGHPDLSAARGVLDYIVAAQPSAVLDLLDQLDAAEALVSKVNDLEHQLNLTAAKWQEAADTITKLQDMVIKEALKEPSP